MAITAKFYPSAPAAMFNGDLNSDSVFKMALLTSSGSYNANHTLWSSISSHQITGSGYTAGGATVTVGPATSNGVKSEFPISTATWTNSTFVFRNAVVYTTSGSLLMHLEFDSDQETANQDYQISAPNPSPSATPL
jgi:hypothetical protein